MAVVMFSVNFSHPAKILTGFRTENLEIFVAFCMLQVQCKRITNDAKCFVGCEFK